MSIDFARIGRTGLNIPLNVALAAGQFPGAEFTADPKVLQYFRKLGKVRQIDSTDMPQDIWGPGGTFDLIALNTQLDVEVVSDSADDAAGGTGIRSVSITRTDPINGTEETLTVELDGVTPVVVPFTETESGPITDMRAVTFGDGGAVGTISVAFNGGTIPGGTIDPGEFVMQSAFWVQPRPGGVGQWGLLLTELYAAVMPANGGTAISDLSAEITLYRTGPGSSPSIGEVMGEPLYQFTATPAGVYLPINGPLLRMPDNIAKMTCTSVVGTDPVDVIASFAGYLIQF